MTSAGGSSNGRQPVRPAASRQSPPCAELHLGATFATVPTRGTTERFRGPGFASLMQFALCDCCVERAQCHAPAELPRSVTFVRAPTPGAPPRLGRNRLSRARSHREQQPTGCSWRDFAPRNPASAPGSCRTLPGQDPAEGSISVGRFSRSDLRSVAPRWLCPPQFPQERWRPTPRFAIDRDDRGPSQAVLSEHGGQIP